MNYFITHIHPPFDPNCKVCVARDRPGLGVLLDAVRKWAETEYGHVDEVENDAALLDAWREYAAAQQREGADVSEKEKR